MLIDLKCLLAEFRLELKSIIPNHNRYKQTSFSLDVEFSEIIALKRINQNICNDLAYPLTWICAWKAIFFEEMSLSSLLNSKGEIAIDSKVIIKNFKKSMQKNIEIDVESRVNLMRKTILEETHIIAPQTLGWGKAI